MKKINLSRLTLKDQVYEYLKTEIMSGGLKPGQRVVEEKIAEDLSVSRSPVREAVHLLEKDGLLTFHGTGGLKVSNPTIEDYYYLFECRIEMESLAAYYAAERRSNDEIATMKMCLEIMKSGVKERDLKGVLTGNADFHESIVKASHNPFLINLTMQLRGINSFYRRAILENNPSYIESAYKDHEKIFNSIVEQDPEKAKRVMRNHIEKDFDSFKKTLANPGR